MTNLPNLPPVTDDDVAKSTFAYWHRIDMANPGKVAPPAIRAALDAYRSRLIANGHATEPTPAPLVVLPTVDEIARELLESEVMQGETDGVWDEMDNHFRDSYLYSAAVVLDLLESRVPHWERIEPGTDVKAGPHLLLFKPSGEYACVIAAQDSELSPDPNGGTWYVDPRTIPAEPEDPALAVIIEWMDTPPLGNDAADASDLLARIDAARADA